MDSNRCREEATMMHLENILNLIIKKSIFNNHKPLQIEKNETLDNGFAGIMCKTVRFTTIQHSSFKNNHIFGGGGN